MLEKNFVSAKSSIYNERNPSKTHLVDGGADPVDAGITADGLVLGVDEDDLVVLVGGVLVDPVGVQDAQVSGAAANTLLSSRLESTLVLELVDSVVGGLACSRNRTLAKKILPFRRFRPFLLEMRKSVP